MTELHVISHRCVRISFSRPSQAACTNSHLLETGVEGTWIGRDPSVFFYAWYEVGSAVLRMCRGICITCGVAIRRYGHCAHGMFR